jgi:hypothetical protein
MARGNGLVARVRGLPRLLAVQFWKLLLNQAAFESAICAVCAFVAMQSKWPSEWKPNTKRISSQIENFYSISVSGAAFSVGNMLASKRSLVGDGTHCSLAFDSKRCSRC